MSLTNSFSCTDGGLYHLRQAGDDVYWFGERKDGAFASVFVGRRSGLQVSGRFFTIPKGRLRANGDLTLTVSGADSVLEFAAGSPLFQGIRWTACNLPNAAKVAARRAPDPNAFPDDEPDLPDPEPPSLCDQLLAASVPRKAGFQAEGPLDLTGTWRGDDRLFHYLRQLGADLVWMGERPGTCHVFAGTRDGDTVTGLHVEVPKGGRAVDATPVLPVTYTLRQHPALGSGVLDRVSGPGATRLSRYEQIDVDVRLEELILHRAEDAGNRDEPFLWTAFVKIDGDGVDVSTVTEADDPGFGLQLLNALGAASPTVVSTSGSHHNLTADNNVREGTRLRIPDRVGRFSTGLRTITGLDPTFPLALPQLDEPKTARDLTALGFVAIAWEEDGFTDGMIEKGREALVRDLESEIDGAIAQGNFTDLSSLEASAKAAVKKALEDNKDLKFLSANADDLIDVEFRQFTFADLLAAGGEMRLDLDFRRPADQRPARYQVTGRVRVAS